MMNLHDCDHPGQLLFEFLLLFCQFLNDDDLRAIRETFQSMDDDDSGIIDSNEIRKAFNHISAVASASSVINSNNLE